MIKVKLLNSEASLNDFLYIGSIDFIPGENVKVSIQIFDSQKNIRYIPPVASTLTMTFIDKDGNDVVKIASVIHADDRSMWRVLLSQAETENLGGQNVIIDLDVNGDGTLIYRALLANAIIRNNLSGDC